MVLYRPLVHVFKSNLEGPGGVLKTKYCNLLMNFVGRVLIMYLLVAAPVYLAISVLIIKN